MKNLIRKRKKSRRQMCRLLTVLLLILSAGRTVPAGTGTAYAAELPETESETVIGWNEIGERIGEKNPAWLICTGLAEAPLEIISSAKDEFDSEMQCRLDEIDESLESIQEQKKKYQQLPTGTETEELTRGETRRALEEAEKSLKETQRAIKNSMGQFQSALKKSRNETQEELIPVREQLTEAAEELYYTYVQLRIGRDLLKQQEKAGEEILEIRKKSLEKGLAPEESLTDSRLDLCTLENGCMETERAMEEVRTALFLQLGLEPESGAEIGSLPEPDREYVKQADPEKDFQILLQNSREIKDLEEYEGYPEKAAVVLRDLTLRKARTDARLRLDSLYDEMLAAEGRLEACKAALRTAETENESTQELFRAGQLSETDRILSGLQYETRKAEEQKAEAELFHAVTAYRHALIAR